MPNSPLLVRYHGPRPYQQPHQEGKFVYHIRQKNMHGDDLYSLNDLKGTNPPAYETAVKKYEGREHILSAKVLASEEGALWNDHIFFSPIDPSLILQELVSLGYDASRFDGMEVYKIPVSRLEGHTNLVFEYSHPDKPNDIDVMNADTKRIDINQYDFNQEIRESTRQYWKDSLAANQKPLLFSGIPHILTYGKVNVADCETYSLLQGTGCRPRLS